jgi:hypothetical protein
MSAIFALLAADLRARADTGATRTRAQDAPAHIPQRPGHGVVQQARLLQGTIGNQAMLRLLPRPTSGAGMNESANEHEQRVDRAARLPQPSISLAEGASLRRKCQECDDQNKLSRKAADERRLSVSNGVDDLDLEDEEAVASVDGPDESPAGDSMAAGGNGAAANGGQALSDGGAPSASCPTSTAVDSTVDLTPAGLAAGYLTAYGSMARMKVLPDATTWDGVSVVESMVSGNSTCPATLTQPGPCRGGSTFVVGAASGRSNVQPVQPAARNTFYDFHTTHTRALSVLHDSTRNPAGVNSCQVVCNQTYSCGGAVIGHHTITRSFSKGTFKGQDVTMVSVTKT